MCGVNGHVWYWERGGMAGIDSLITRLPPSLDLSALLNDCKVRQLGAWNEVTLGDV